MLLLKRHLVDLVRRGKKRQTIRLWTRPLLRPNQISYTPGLGRMRIIAVDLLPSIQALTEEDARLDGFESLRDLLSEITRIYGPRPDSCKKIYRIQFEWPIDNAGKALVLPDAMNPSTSAIPHKPAVRKPRRPANTVRQKKTPMSPPQREALRSFILAQKPV